MASDHSDFFVKRYFNFSCKQKYTFDRYAYLDSDQARNIYHNIVFIQRRPNSKSFRYVIFIVTVVIYNIEKVADTGMRQWPNDVIYRL